MSEENAQQPDERPGALARVRGLWFFRRDKPLSSPAEVIGWWEARRIPYNLIVGSVGILTCIIVGVVAAASLGLFDSDFGLPDPPLFALVGILLYGIGANVCYTGGWVMELVLRKIWPREADKIATMSFSLGVVLSVLLTLSPGLVVGAVGFFKFVRHILGALTLQPTDVTVAHKKKLNWGGTLF